MSARRICANDNAGAAAASCARLALMFVAGCIVLASTLRCGAAESTPKAWTLERLEPSLVRFAATPRSFQHGRRVFREARCVACHRMDGEGGEYGPDLTKLDRELAPTDILRHILEPSNKIHRDFRSHRFVLKSGKIVEGLIVAAGVGNVRVLENPLKSTQPKIVRLDDIEQRSQSRVSQMPTGLLDRFSEAEVLDVLAYVYARGSDRAAIFNP